MTASRALLYYLIALGISIGGLLFVAAWPANAQQAPAPACATLEMRLNEAKKMGIAPSEILVIDDVAFINDYTKAVGLGIPDGSSPKQIILITFDTKAYVGLVEPDGCVRYEAAIPSKLHIEALKAATSGV